MSARGMKVLVTGQTGFVGTHFTKHIGAANVVAFPESVDLLDFDKTNAFVREQSFDAVLHLAARSSVADSLANPSLTKDVNVEGSRNLLRSLTDRKFAGTVLLVSSGEVYGQVDESKLPVQETAPTAPRNPYAESKVAMENLVLSGEFAKSTFTSIIARPFNHIGPGQSENFVIASFAGQLARRKLGHESGPMKTGDLSVTRDFTDVRDIVAAYAKLLARDDFGSAPGEAGGEIFNLGSGVETRVQSLLEMLVEISGTSTKFEIDATRLRASEQQRMCADISKIRAAIDWQPRYKIRDTLSECFNFALAKESNSERITT